MKNFSRINTSVPTDSEVQSPPVFEVESEVLSLYIDTTRVI